MADNGEKPNGGWKIKPMSVGAATLSYFGGILTTRLAGDSPLPLETLSWVLKGGTAAILLVAVTVLGWMFWEERKAHAKTRDRLESKVEVLTEKAFAPIAPVMRKLTKVLAVTCEVLKGRAILESDLSTLDDTPEDGYPTLKPKEPPA